MDAPYQPIIAAPMALVMWSYPGAMSMTSGPERVEGRLVAQLHFLLHLQLDLIHGDVAGPFDHDLHVVLPGLLGQFAEDFEFANCAASLASAIEPGRKPSPREKLTSCFLKILQMSSKRS